MTRAIFRLFPIALAALGAVHASASDAPSQEISYNRDIRTILSDNCFRCHGPDEKDREARLRLDVRESAIDKEVIIPGKPDESEVIYRLTIDDPDERMPPPDTHKTLTAEQIDLLSRWIEQGANYEPHWSYAPVNRPATPEAADSKWPQSPVDNFVLARLAKAGIQPAATADRRTLLRRLSLDLTGLPPTPEETERFVRDRSPNAYRKQIERLLASPAYGERMAVPWLDAVRFSDTVGYHGDQNQNIFPYRDYVIDSFNRNKPFDQFTIEQIAGDLLPDPTVEQRIATGFNRLNMMTREGGAQPKEYIAKYMADRVRTVSTAWLGSTLACAECHDHKFDPFSQRDFYAMGAFFADLKQWGVYSSYQYTPNPDLAGFTNDYPFPPEINVSSPYLVRREAELRARRDELIVRTAKSRSSEIAAWKASLRSFLKANPDGWKIDPRPQASSANDDTKTRFAIQADGSILCEGEPAKDEKIEVRVAPGKTTVAALRFELLPHAAHGNTSLQRSKGIADFKLSAAIHSASGKKKNLEFSRSDATRKRPVFESGYELQDAHPIWKMDTADAKQSQHAVFVLEQPIAFEDGDALVVKIISDDLGSFRIATSPIAASDPLKSGSAGETAATFLLSTDKSDTSAATLRSLDRDILECRNGTVPTLVTETIAQPAITRVLDRGDWQDEDGEIVAPAVPHFLPQPSGGESAPLTRLDLAQWLVSRENPLTARAFVNRLWKQFFGNGLANQPEDLGAQGELPSHPDLMDWLAAEFMESGWDVKRMVRLMVESSAYQQSSKNRPELFDQDPNNRLLARQNPRRLDAEFIRDNALFIAGMLNTEIGGPSAYPYQPEDYYAPIQFPNRTYVASDDERQYRRGLYTHWQRSFLHPMMANFDAPSREECAVDRPNSTTPQQALTLLNDPTFVEAARVFAAKLLFDRTAKTDSARIGLAFETALLRAPTADEAASLLEFLESQRIHYADAEPDAKKLLGVGQSPAAASLPAAEHAAWTALARVVLNLQETITRY